MLLRLRLALLYLLPGFSSAFYTPTSFPRSVANAPVGCQRMFDNGYAFLPFESQEEPAFHFGVKTTYHTYYPKILASALRAERFRLLSLPNDQNCGWRQARIVRSNRWLGAHRGDVYWKYHDLRWTSGLKGSNSSPHWVTDSPAHVPPNTAELPRNETLDRIAAILEKYEPAGDVYEISTIFLSYFCGCLGFVLVVVMLQYYLITSSETKDDDPHAIELDTMAADDASKLASTETVGTDSGDLTAERDQLDPPPLYTLDGASRMV